MRNPLDEQALNALCGDWSWITGMEEFRYLPTARADDTVTSATSGDCIEADDVWRGVGPFGEPAYPIHQRVGFGQNVLLCC